MRQLLPFLTLLAAASAFIPISPFLQGNKKRVAKPVVRLYTNTGACAPFIEEWQVWDNGFLAKIRVSEIGSRSWRPNIALDRSVDRLSVYEGVSEQTSGAQFLVTPKPYDTEIVVLHGEFGLNAVAPRPKTIQLNYDDAVECNGGSAAVPPVAGPSAEPAPPAVVANPSTVPAVIIPEPVTTTTTTTTAAPTTSAVANLPSAPTSGNVGPKVPLPSKVIVMTLTTEP